MERRVHTHTYIYIYIYIYIYKSSQCAGCSFLDRSGCTESVTSLLFGESTGEQHFPTHFLNARI